MMDDKEMSYFIYMTSVNPLLSHKTKLKIAGELFNHEESMDGTLSMQWIFNYCKGSHTATKDMTEKSHGEQFYLLISNSSERRDFPYLWAVE